MRTVTYKCNLCGEVRERNEIVEMYWDSTVKTNDGHFGAYVLRTVTDQSDRHICHDCIRTVQGVPLTR